MDKTINHDTITAVDISDAEIISRVLTGEKDMFALLVQRYNQRLYRIGMSIINDDNEMEDVMQVAYIKAYENLASFAFKSAFSTWLARILINESLLRKKKKKLLFAASEGVIENKLFQLPVGRGQTPLMKTINSELKAVLEDAISRLPEKYRTVFIMREIEDMNVADTMQCLDLSEVNVKVRLNRAKAMLRNSLSHFYKKEDLLHFHLARCGRVADNVTKQIEKL